MKPDIRVLLSVKYDPAVLDVMMPKIDLFALAQEILYSST